MKTIQPIQSCYTFDSPVGKITVMENDIGICRLFVRNDPSPIPPDQPSPLLYEAAKQLNEYFLGHRQSFSLPLSIHGSPFQCAVWNALQNIPYGQTRSYAQIAADIGNPKAYRAVGMANHNNPLMILIPCHRVIGKNGSLTGYAGGLNVKRYLLSLEQISQ